MGGGLSGWKVGWVRWEGGCLGGKKMYKFFVTFYSIIYF